jgi:hypothetical protein
MALFLFQVSECHGMSSKSSVFAEVMAIFVLREGCEGNIKA